MKGVPAGNYVFKFSIKNIVGVVQWTLVWLLYCSLSTFHATGLLLYPLKTSENLWFSDVFRGYRKGPVTWNGLNQYIFSYSSLQSHTTSARLLLVFSSLKRFLLCNISKKRKSWYIIEFHHFHLQVTKGLGYNIKSHVQIIN